MGKKNAVPSVSMKMVGSLAGVSAMTVSRALKEPDTVSSATLARIQSVIARIGYVPNHVAGSLSSSKSTHVALVVPSLRTAIFAEIIQGISDVLKTHGFQLMISDSSNSPALEEAAVRGYAAQRVAGVILHNTRHGAGVPRILAAAGIPCVETGDLVRKPIDSVVSFANSAAGAAMAGHLLDAGYRRMAFVSLPVRNRERILALRRGFMARLRKDGVTIPSELVLEVPTGMASGAEAIGRILDLAPTTQVTMFSGDVLAAGALFECQRRGVALPGDMAIANSDDSELFRNTLPDITSIQAPRYEIGARAAQWIVDRVRGTAAAGLIHDVGYSIVQRHST
ncbi:LacI family DNA-binding transcriptional regulator [soil metagenome]